MLEGYTSPTLSKCKMAAAFTSSSPCALHMHTHVWTSAERKDLVLIVYHFMLNTQTLMALFKHSLFFPQNSFETD